MSNPKSKANLVAGLQQMVAGLTKHFTGQTLPLNGGSLTTAEIVSELNGFITQLQATDAAQVTWKTQLAAQRTSQATQINPLVAVLHSYVEAVFGAASPTVADFGMTPRKRTEPSVETRAEAYQKTLATRAARHTGGKRQKAKVHGTPAVPPAPNTPNTSGGGGSKT